MTPYGVRGTTPLVGSNFPPLVLTNGSAFAPPTAPTTVNDNDDVQVDTRKESKIPIWPPSTKLVDEYQAQSPHESNTCAGVNIFRTTDPDAEKTQKEFPGSVESLASIQMSVLPAPVDYSGAAQQLEQEAAFGHAKKSTGFSIDAILSK